MMTLDEVTMKLTELNHDHRNGTGECEVRVIIDEVADYEVVGEIASIEDHRADHNEIWIVL